MAPDLDTLDGVCFVRDAAPGTPDAYLATEKLRRAFVEKRDAYKAACTTHEAARAAMYAAENAKNDAWSEAQNAYVVLCKHMDIPNGGL